MAAAYVASPQFAVGRRDTLFADPYVRGPTSQFDVFPSGREFLMFRAEGERRSQLLLVVNWPRLIGLSGESPPR